MDLLNLTTVCVLTPLVGAIIAGFFRQQLGPKGAHSVTIAGVGIACVCAILLNKAVLIDGASLNHKLYTWVAVGQYDFSLGFLIDPLSVMMLFIVTFISLLVHIYSIGYMAGDAGYQRFFSYMSLFTFMMLMLVTANNFLQLFFGWEGVGLVSYLLIGFWFHKESAVQGSLKAFLVNRVGDFGFILGIAAVLAVFGSIDYQTVFAGATGALDKTISIIPGHDWSMITVICLLLFTGAMGKSAQVPLHVWLPESMEGPTPISALIHAATMVTAGIYMVARMSPLFELSTTALAVIIAIGATGALFTGLIAIVQNDIKRIVAYSTLSQLGYMMAALGASAYAAGVFHLFTHAFFKALLFLGAGSCIMAMHHEQDIRKMGGLKKYMPITYITVLIGSLALVAVPPFAGFYSKEAIIEAMQLSNTPMSTYGYWCLTLGAFVTALYTFRSLFLVFHTQPRMDDETRAHCHESPKVVTIPLILLAIPSLILGALAAQGLLFDGMDGLFGTALYVLPEHDVLAEMGKHYHGWFAAILHAPTTLPFWLAISGIAVAYVSYELYPAIPKLASKRCKGLVWVLQHKYGFDAFYDKVFVKGGRMLGQAFYDIGDTKGIDRAIVKGASTLAIRLGTLLRSSQTGYLYHYTFAMMLGLFVMLLWLLLT